MVPMPEKPAAGKRIPTGWFTRLWNTIYSAAHVTGDGKYIMVRQTTAGTSISFNPGSLPASAGGGAAGGGNAYNGPFAVRYNRYSGYQTLSIDNAAQLGVVNFNGETRFTVNMSLNVTSAAPGMHTLWLSIVTPYEGTWSLQLALDLQYTGEGGSVDPRFNFPLAYWDKDSGNVTQIQCAPKICTIYAVKVTL